MARSGRGEPLVIAIGILVACFLSARADTESTVSFRITPAATGMQLVRFPLILPPGLLKDHDVLSLQPGHGPTITPAVRILSWHPATPGTPSEPRSARAILVTFSHDFDDKRAVTFSAQAAPASAPAESSMPVTVSLEGASLVAEWRGGRTLKIEALAPPLESKTTPRLETVESNSHYRWVRAHFDDPKWPRIVEYRLDSLGAVVAMLHLQRVADKDGFAPELGWKVSGPAQRVELGPRRSTEPAESPVGHHEFADGMSAVSTWDAALQIDHPTAPLKRRGGIQVLPTEPGHWLHRYLRCSADDMVPMQPWSWQRAEVVISPLGLAPLTATLSLAHTVEVLDDGASTSAEVAGSKRLPTELQPLVDYHRQALLASSAVGDDFGNLTAFQAGSAHGVPFGMNRLNHNGSIFDAAWRHQDQARRELAVLWCENFYDQSIWWGEPDRGGTRYNNLVAMNQTPPTSSYMWRSNSAVHFCTKGYDSFWQAWEQTGDPRMRDALEAQIAYAARQLHADRGECRNVGDVRDFVRLYRWTGEPRYLAEALRLFRELRTKLSPDFLFDQGGKPLAPNPPFIDDDQRGLTIGYAKPYIVGYGLAGLPELLEYAPDEPALRETGRAIADFLAETIDPAGGWRYPHPRSSLTLLSFGVEHAWQLCQAAERLGAEPKWLDAIELVLRARVHGFRKTGTILSSLEGWELSTGRVKSRVELQDLYARPSDRDFERDYDEGRLSTGWASPEGIVALETVLEFYLRHRPLDRLLREPDPAEPLARILRRY